MQLQTYKLFEDDDEVYVSRDDVLKLLWADEATVAKKETVGDAISRAEAIRIASGFCHPANIAKELEKLPSIHPPIPTEDLHREKEQAYMLGYEEGRKPRKGRWIYHPDWENDGECGYECSECGMGSDINYAFCMRCGTDMRGEYDG